MFSRAHVLRLIFAVACLITAGRALGRNSDNLLLHWDFDEGRGATVTDRSGNGLDGTVKASWTESPGGHAVLMDGKSSSIVSVKVPEDKRFGKRSWTFMAMLKPIQLKIDDRQNQRRIFAFGTYPAAYQVIDVTGDGRLTCYFCYRDQGGKTVAIGGSSDVSIAENSWVHVALVCDRPRRQIKIHINGYSSGSGNIPPGFDGDFRLGEQLTVGSGWHNFWGLVDEVKIFRSAQSQLAVEKEFERLRNRFQVIESPEVIAAKKRATLERVFLDVNEAWKAGELSEVRDLCQTVVSSYDAPAHFRSYAQLRAARSHLVEGNLAAAKSTYDSIAANAAYPAANGNFGAIQMNSGRDNLMDNNLFIDCKQGISGGYYPGNNVWRMLRAGQKPDGFYMNSLYLDRYQRLATMLDEPAVNHIWRNVFYRCGTVATRPANLDFFQNGVFPEADPGFMDAENEDFRLRSDAELFQTVGFKPIPFDEIGLYDAASRATWPVQVEPVEMPDWRRTTDESH